MMHFHDNTLVEVVSRSALNENTSWLLTKLVPSMMLKGALTSRADLEFISVASC